MENKPAQTNGVKNATAPASSKTTEEILSDFYFLIFTPNPVKSNVRIIIDDGTIKLWTNIDKFVKIIRLIMNDEMAQVVKTACTTYGCYFLIDRCENDIKKLNIKSEESIINIKQLHNDIEKAKQVGDKDKALRERFINTINTPVQERLSKQTMGDYVSHNRFSGTIVYNVNKFGGYKPY